MSFDMSYESIKLSHQVRDFDTKIVAEQKRQVLCLILSYLKDEGYLDTVQSLTSEANGINQYEVCDNIDLLSIVKEYENYYYVRFQKYPKIYKNIDISDKDSSTSLKRKTNRKLMSRDNSRYSIDSSRDQLRNQSQCKPQQEIKEIKTLDENLKQGLTILPIGTNSVTKLKASSEKCEENLQFERILKPLRGFNGLCGDWRELAESITKEICLTNPNVHWNDVIGVEEAKKLLKEAVVYPIKYPELFTGILAPWKGLLLYGPPGTGKTLLAKAVATKCKTTFFNISASTIVSKWRGDSEKLVRVLFELARYHAPSTIFLDEIDAIASHRDNSGEHEGSKRLKAELLIQLDGLIHSNDNVFLLATSNLPWELDTAILRRLEKRILVDLPTKDARRAMVKHYLPPIVLQSPKLQCEVDYDHVAELTVGYSGSDIKLVCKETVMESMRTVFSLLEHYDNESSLPKLELKTINTDDVKNALTKTKPSAAHLENRYKKWQKEFGSV